MNDNPLALEAGSRMIRTAILTAWLVYATTWAGAVGAQTEGTTSTTLHPQVTLISPGTVVPSGTADGRHLARWNRRVLVAKPRIASGDTSALPEFIRQTVSKFHLTILATVDTQTVASPDTAPASAAAPPKVRFRLAEVGVGYSLALGTQLTVIRSDDYEAHGASLSFIDRQFLSQNLRQLDEIRTVARTASLLMFDVPTILFHDGQHVDCVSRHVIWIDRRTGHLATVVWLLRSQGDKVIPDSSFPPRWIDSSQIEDRSIHVDQTQFTLGIPGKRAFALEHLPPGRNLNWSEELLELASLSHYDAQALRALMKSLLASPAP
ncbi:MAG: hypothetical protein KF752_17030 [Pirellulaceae bacterium]|nr:hypothetical protein [Pirellulaceae bacterium]